jgi:Prolipoprotein diacylglyceryltransferase
VLFEWPRFAGASWLEIVNPATGGLAIHGALIGAVVAAALYTRWHRLPLRIFLDIAMPPFLLAQAIGRWGNFMNQEAYGSPTHLGFGVLINEQHRIGPYRDMQQFPPDTLFHPTFLYESVWDLIGFGVLIWLERRLRDWLRPLDIALFYAIWYGLGALLDRRIPHRPSVFERYRADHVKGRCVWRNWSVWLMGHWRV